MSLRVFVKRFQLRLLMETTKTRDYECISELLLVRQFKAPIDMRLHRRLLKEVLLYVWNLLLRNAFLKKEQNVNLADFAPEKC